jgi:hypothetical protein
MVVHEKYQQNLKNFFHCQKNTQNNTLQCSFVYFMTMGNFLVNAVHIT